MSAGEVSVASAHPRSVAAVVRAARLGLSALRVAECGLFVAAGALATRAAALASGVESGATGVALLAGFLAAASWWLEHPSPPGATARALDAAFRHQGALALAFELEGRAARGLNAMEELVCARVRASLRLGPALRAVLPSPFVPLAAPVLAGLCLLLVMDRRGAHESEEADLRALGAGLESALSIVEPGAGVPGDEGRELRREVQELRARLEASAAPGLAPAERARIAEDVRLRLEQLDRSVAELSARDASAREPSTRALLEARAWLDSLRAALPGDQAAGAGGEGSMSGNGTGRVPDGTISRPMSRPDMFRPEALPTRVPETSPTRSLGLQAGSFWPAEYDAVVERWLELSRAAEAGGVR